MIPQNKVETKKGETWYLTDDELMLINCMADEIIVSVNDNDPSLEWFLLLERQDDYSDIETEKVNWGKNGF